MPDYTHTNLWVGSGKAVGNQGIACGRGSGLYPRVVKLAGVGVGKGRFYTRFVGSFYQPFTQAFSLFFNLLVGAFYTQSTTPITTITIK